MMVKPFFNHIRTGGLLDKFRALWEMFCQVLEIMPERYRRKLPRLLIYMILSSLLELLSVALVVPFINTILNADEYMKNHYVSAICGILGIEDKYELILAVAMALIAAFVIKNIALLIIRQYQNDFGIDLQKELSTKLLKSYMSRPYSFFLQNNTGYLSGRISGDTTGLYNILMAYMSLVTESLTVLAIGIYVFYTDAFLALGVMFIAGICVVIITFGLKNRVARVGEMRNQATYANSMELVQALGGIKEITIMRRKAHFVRSYYDTYEDRARGEKSFVFYSMLPERIIETFFVGGIILVVTFRMRWGTDMTEYVAKLAAFAMAAYRLLPSISKYTVEFNQLIFFQPSLASGYKAILEAENYKNYEEQLMAETEGDNIRVLSAEIEVRDLTFRYNDDLEPVLHNLSMTIHKGESIGLVGESGAGKSTLADVILGLLAPETGAVYMDGLSIRTIPISWSRNVGYVPQTVYLVDGSVRENVGFGLDKEKIDDEAVWRALDRARLKEFVEHLDGGLNANVGERGVRLSGGQRQRIAIARALYLQPTVLVLDEATSALDNDTEAAIMESIEDLMGSVTLIIIAHRLTTIRRCDSIYEIMDGKAIPRTKAELGI